MNLPNALTALRIFLVPLLVVVLLTRAEHHVFLGAAIFGLAALTDYFDGYLARRRNQVTKLGNVAAARGVLVPASGLGKGKMVAQVVCILLLLLGRKYTLLHPLGVAALWVVVVLALVSGADYFRLFLREVVRGPAPVRNEERKAPPAILPRGGAEAASIAAPRDRRS